MTEHDKAAEQSKRAKTLKEAIRQSTEKSWVKAHYAPPEELLLKLMSWFRA